VRYLVRYHSCFGRCMLLLLLLLLLSGDLSKYN
jgi:hypothetical protein